MRGRSLLQHYIPELTVENTGFDAASIHRGFGEDILAETTAQNASGPSHPPDFPEEIPQMPKKAKKSKNTRYKLIKKAARETAKNSKNKDIGQLPRT